MMSSYFSSLTGGATELTKCGGKVANSFSVIEERILSLRNQSKLADFCGD